MAHTTQKEGGLTMKTRKLTLLSLTILATLLIGTFAFTVLSAPPVLKLKVKWKPATYILGDTAPSDPWNAEIYFAPPRPLTDVDTTTLLLEDTYSPEAPPYPHPSKDRIIVPFHGDDVVDALLSKLPHMAPGIYVVPLEVSGRLTDGRSFRGSGTITLTYPEFPPP